MAADRTDPSTTPGDSPSDRDGGDDGASSWTRVTLTVDAISDPTAAEVGSDVLWSGGAAGVEEQELGGTTVLHGGFADAASAALAADHATRLGFAAEVSAIDDDGLDGWREWAAPVQAGRFWITPTWVAPPDPAEGEQILWIDPGRTFGSGSHPTTRLVLALLDGLVTPGATVLDAGCGSGVLAVGAALNGSGAVLATDIDPASPAVTDANAERNGVAERVHATTTTLAELAARAARAPGGGGSGWADRFDVVAANLLAPVIAEVGPDLVACVAPGGALVVSGLLADRWEASMPALEPLSVDRVVEAEGWVAVVLR